MLLKHLMCFNSILLVSASRNYFSRRNLAERVRGAFG